MNLQPKFMHKPEKKSIQELITIWSQYCDVIDIELIIAHVIEKDRVYVMTHTNTILDPRTVLDIDKLCQQRSDGYPLAYIVNAKHFFGRQFKVDENVLIPRPETEIMIEKIISFIKKQRINNVCIVDIGTGSGIIAITLAKELAKIIDNSQIYATDISQHALQIAKENALLHQVDNIINFYHSDLLSNTKLQNELSTPNCQNIIFAANLPYVDSTIKQHLINQKESSSLAYEPQIALWSGDNGLSHYKKLILQTIELQQNITSFYEIDPNQLNVITRMIHTNISQQIKVISYKDLAQKDRIIKWKIEK